MAGSLGRQSWSTARSGARRGLTLVEVLIGLGVLVTGVLPCLLLFSGHERESALIGQRLVVANHLRELADRTSSECIAGHFRQAAFERGPATRVIGFSETGLSVQERAQFWPSEIVPGLYLLRVEVRWKDPTGSFPGPHELSHVRLVADPEWGSRHHEWPPRSAPGARERATVAEPGAGPAPREGGSR